MKVKTDVFQRAFGNAENATDYINVAIKIKNELSGAQK